MMGLDALPAWALLIVSLLLLVWAVLTFFLPFYVYGAWFRAKECSRKLDETNDILRQILESERGGDY